MKPNYYQLVEYLRRRILSELYKIKYIIMFRFHKLSVSLILLIFTGSIYIFFPQTAVASERSNNQPNGKRVWVMFSDKGISCKQYLDSIADKNVIFKKARIRRQIAQGTEFDELDQPIYQPYIDSVIKLGATLYMSSRWLNGITIFADDKVLEKISMLPYVRSIEPIVTYKTRTPKPDKRSASLAPDNLSYVTSATQLEQIHANILHDKGYHGEGITIALLDTGFNLSHTALKGVKVLAEYDFINNDNITSDQPPADDIGQDDHGTEVLSIIAGNDPDKFVGVAYASDYLLAKTEKVSEAGIMFEKEIEEDWWVAGIEWAEQNGADIVSSSLGYSDWYSYSDINGRTAKTTIAANIAGEKGIAVIVSAGNEGKSSEWPYISAPADGFDVVAVGAVDEFGDLADFSSIGPTYDGRIKPDLVAMGEGTYVVDPANVNAYRKANGTSMATPLVAGTIALLKQALPEITRNKMLVKLLKYTASRALNPDNRYGWGLINAEAAYRYAKFPGSIMELDNWDPNGLISDYGGVNIYPNPVKVGSSKNIMNIHSNKPIRNIRIYDITGLLIYKRLNMDDARFITWNLRNEQDQRVASGVYICFIEYSAGTYETRKIAIVK
jgi:serine protease AprX